MISLYHAKDTRSLRCLWLLEELGLPYQLHWVAFPPALKQPQFLAVNPAGTLPWLVDADQAIGESVAILLHLALRHGEGRLMLAPDDPGHAALLHWTLFGETELASSLSTMLRYSLFLPKAERHPAVAEDYRNKALRGIAQLETALQTGPWLCGTTFTIADISVGYALLLAELFGLSAHFPPATAAYLQRLKDRPALIRARELTPPASKG